MRRVGVAARIVGLGLVVGLGTLAFRGGRPQAPARPPTTSTSTAPAFDGQRAWADLQQLVAIGPRPAGSAAIRETRAFLTRELSTLGLVVEEQPFTADTPLGKVDMTNLIVTLPGRLADRVLLTGHYDTKLFTNQVFVGANDGASSAAILIELARALQPRPHALTYEFVWFDGEEAICRGWDECGRPNSPDNTYGSRYYVQAARRAHALASIKAMILFDMIGARHLRLDRDGYSTPWLNDIIWAAAKRLGHGDVFVDVPTQIEDDHLPFVHAGVPSVDLIDLNDYPAWHNTNGTDTLDKVSAESLQIVGDVTLAALPDIERRILQ